MKFLLLVILILSTSVSCTLYKSEGREAIEENKQSILTVSGSSLNNKINYKCYQSAVPPVEMSGPLEVVETQYDNLGFSSYLYSKNNHDHVLVYKDDTAKDEVASHTYCRMNFDESVTNNKENLSLEAIDLGVFQLLDPENYL